MRRLLLSVAVLATLLLNELKGACPSYQKFAGTSVAKCAANNQGVKVPITCDVAITKYAIFGWLKIATDDSIFSGANTDVLFSLINQGDNFKRMQLQFKIGTGLQLLTYDSLGGALYTTTIFNPNTDNLMRDFRTRWFPLIMWVSDSSSPPRTLNIRLGDLSQGAPTNFYDTPASVVMYTAIPTPPVTLTQNDLAINMAAFYFGGNPLLTATTLPNIPANTNFGGCSIFKNVVFLPNYNPTAPGPLAISADVIIDHLFENANTYPIRIKNYFFRIKAVPLLDLIIDCDIPSSVQTQMSSSNNLYIVNGIQLGYGDYYECVNNNMVSVGDVVLSFRLAFSQLPTTDVNIVTMSAKSLASLVPLLPTTATNTLLPVWFNFIKLGCFLTSAGKIKIYSMGMDHTLPTTFAVNQGYAVTLVAKKYDDDFYAGVLASKTLFMVYINGVLTETFVMLGNMRAFYDVSGSGAERNNFFYIGDFMTNSINRYNYVFLTPNPLNNFGPSNSEKTFTAPFMNLQDIVVYENATVSREPNLLPPNCLLGVPSLSQCLVCLNTYVLTSKYQCTLKSALPSYAVISNFYDLQIECGDGLFFNTGLNICQYCTSDCQQCTGIGSTSCQIYQYCPTCSVQTCSSNCATCTNSGLCLTCMSGFALNTISATSANCVTCNVPNCQICSSASVNTCLQCVTGRFINSGTGSCDPCSAVGLI